MATDSPEVLERIKVGLDLVDTIARSMRKQMGAYIDVDDLASSGKEALINAARSFEPDRGVPFKSWAGLRIRGAMMECFRTRGPLPKRVYRKLRAMQAADNVLEIVAEENSSSTPPSAEIADEKLADALTAAATAMAIGMLAMKSVDDMRTPPKDERESPEDEAAREEMVRIFQDVLNERPENERTLIKRHYFDEVTMEQAATELGLSKSWASRLHARAMEGIARSLKRRRIEGA